MNTNLTKEFDLDGEVMSEGEYQKVIIARTFAKKAAINIFDEPSSALDPISEYNLYSSIIKNQGKSIMIFISYRLCSVKDADIVYLLQHGNLIEKGSHDELMKKNGIFLFKICFQISPLYVLLYIIDVIRKDVVIFLEFTFGF